MPVARYNHRSKVKSRLPAKLRRGEASPAIGISRDGAQVSQFEARASISRDYRETSHPRKIDRPRFLASATRCIDLAPFFGFACLRAIACPFRGISERARYRYSPGSGVPTSRTHRGSDMSSCLFMFTRRRTFLRRSARLHAPRSAQLIGERSARA